jgi:hypothetical protein
MEAQPQSQAKSLPVETARNRWRRVTTGARLARTSGFHVRWAIPWFYSTLAQSSAAIVGLAGGFMVSRALAQRADLTRSRLEFRTEVLRLQEASEADLSASLVNL